MGGNISHLYSWENEVLRETPLLYYRQSDVKVNALNSYCLGLNPSSNTY